MIPKLLAEMEREANTTRKMLERVPDDKFDWKPHAKSMNVRSLATHIAELPGWVTMAIHTDGLDFAASPYEPRPIQSNAELMQYFEEMLADTKNNLANADEATFGKTWTLSHGDNVLYEAPKEDVIRMAYSQIVHHRAQMGVYLRLLDVPIPGSYGPSADEH